MEYVTLGRSGIKVSRISMGTHHLDQPSDIKRHGENVVYAYKKGINFFETSVSYGEGYGELILGEAIKEMKKGKLPFYIMSKTHFADHETFRRDLERSLKRLGLDSLDVFTCLWGVKSYQEWLGAKKHKAIEEMIKAKEEGLIRFIAITTHMQDEEMKKVMEDYPFDINMQGFNGINAPYRLGGLKAAWESGAGVIAMNPLGTGDLLEFSQIFDGIRCRKEQTLVQAAYDYVLSQPYVHSVIGAYNDQSQIDEAVRVIESHRPYSEEEFQGIEENLRSKIGSLPLSIRIKAGAAIRKRAYILREEAADRLNVYPMSI